MTQPGVMLMGDVPCPRVEAGAAATESLWVAFDPAVGRVPATLWISQQWDGATFAIVKRYRVAAVERVGLRRHPRPRPVRGPRGRARRRPATELPGRGHRRRRVV